LEVARRTYVDLGVNIHAAGNEALRESLEQLPASCQEAAAALDADRLIYTSGGVFPDDMIDYLIKTLKSFGPEDSVVENNLHIA
ncbi:MAG: hypothetical protein IJL86_06050, partial [Bacteroidales bacterium]|nr:hypothetical protein [Bacteroidales bacterium]